MSQPYVMPRPALGPCLWYGSLGAEPCAALITSIGSRTVSVIAFPPETRAGVCFDGTRHASDPEFPMLRAHAGGVWDFTPDQLVLAALVDTLK